MDTYDLAHKLSYLGARSAVPFVTGPTYTNSVPGVPVLAEIRVFIPPDQWSADNVKLASREICRALGPTAQFDIGITVGGKASYDADRPAAGNVARLMKLNPDEPDVLLRMRDGMADALFGARFPRLQFEPTGEDFWRAIYGPALVKLPSEQ